MSGPKFITDLLSSEITWVKEAGFPRWFGRYNEEKCELNMNDFPTEPLYTVTWRGESLDFDDAPSKWSIPRN
jgi:hypothetical protein